MQGEEEKVGCYIPWQLRELYYKCSEFNSVLSLKGCNQLEILHLSLVEMREATNLKDLEDMPTLQHLMIKDCRISSEWPDLSKSRKLEVSRLSDCYAEMELQEDEIRMLASLPLLQPLQVDNSILHIKC